MTFATHVTTTLLAIAALSACSSKDSPRPAAATTPDGGTDFRPPGDPGKGGFLVTVSGEELAATGYEWSPASSAEGDPPAFVDGWSVQFDHVIFTVDAIRVSRDPDKNDGDPQDLGPVVASASGPFAVDARLGGDVPGKSGSPDERTVAVAAFSAQENGEPFDPQTRYAFSYDIVAAAPNAKIVNLDAAGLALYEEAKQKGWAMIFAGKATYKGPTTDAGAGGVFEKIPREVTFKLGMANATSFINCRNTDLQKLGDEFPRGIQANANESTTVQITMHTDHLFWSKLNVEGSTLHFDAIAANASTYGAPASPGAVTLDDLLNVDVTGFQTRAGEPLPWRSLVADFVAPAGPMRFDANGTSFTKANSFAAYLAYSATAGGHMNADGECEVKNNYTP